MNNQHANLIRQFNQNPSEPSARELLNYLGRTLTAAAPLSQLTLEASASNWNRIWQSLDELATQDAETLELICAALNICLESWPANLRVLPPAFYRRFEQIKDSPQAPKLLPGLRLIRHSKFEYQLPDIRFSGINLLKHCADLHSVEIRLPSSQTGILKLAEQLPHNLRALKLYCEDAQQDWTIEFLSTPVLKNLETLAIYGTSALDQFFAHCPFKKTLSSLDLRPLYRPLNPNWLAEEFDSSWRSLQKLTINDYCFADSAHCLYLLQEQHNLAPIKIYQHSHRDKSRLEHLLASISQTADIQHSVKIIPCSLIGNPNSYLDSEAFDLSLASELSFVVNDFFMPSSPLLEKLSSIESIELYIDETPSVSDEHSLLLRCLQNFSKAGLLDKIHRLRYSAAHMNNAVATASAQFELPELELFDYSSKNKINHTELAAIFQAFQSQTLNSMSLSPLYFDLAVPKAMTLPSTLTELCLNGHHYDLDSLNKLVNTFSSEQLLSLELNCSAIDSSKLLENPKLHGIKKLNLRGMNQFIRTDASETLASGKFQKLERLRIRAFGESEATIALYSGALPALLELELLYSSSTRY